MKGRPVDEIVFECMFPKAKSGDPQNFQAFLQRNLVPEVRHETQAFYGHLTSQEAKYPGLDYSYGPHRNRLSRFPWHRRLFRAFDTLGLTEHEIATLTKWEGTRWAKERFEKEQGIVIRDTTGDGIEDWVPPELRSKPHSPPAVEEEANQSEENDLEEDDEESDTEVTSVGTALNERLRSAVAQRHAGDLSVPIDAEWEQWLKDEADREDDHTNNLRMLANTAGSRSSPPGLARAYPSTIARLMHIRNSPNLANSRGEQHTAETFLRTSRPLNTRPGRSDSPYSIAIGNYYRNIVAHNAEENPENRRRPSAAMHDYIYRSTVGNNAEGHSSS